MPENRRVLGECPVCEQTIPTARLLIEYEKRGGTRALFAECPDCEDVVHPR